MKTVALEDIVPFMDETPITEQTFIDFGFERCDVKGEKEGEPDYHYYTHVLCNDSMGYISLCLDSSDDFNEALLFDTDRSFKTVGELKMLLMLFAE